MAIHADEGGTVLTGSDVHMFAHMSLASRLGIEIRTGLKHSAGSSMLAAARVCGSTKRTKAGVLRDYLEWMQVAYPHYRPSPSVVKALGVSGDAALVAEVRAYALAHYDDGGWDVVVECWSDDDIAGRIGRARTLKGALKKMASMVDWYSERATDAENSKF